MGLLIIPQWKLFFFSVNAFLFSKRKGFNGEADEFGDLGVKNMDFLRERKTPEKVQKFKEEWHGKSKEIKNNPLTSEGKSNIWNKYQIQKLTLEKSCAPGEHTWELENIFESLESESAMALEIAHTKYQETEKPIRKSKVDTFGKSLDAVKN